MHWILIILTMELIQFGLLISYKTDFKKKWWDKMFSR